MIQEENFELNITYTHFVGVKFANTPRAYFFGTDMDNLKEGDPVVVETIRGKELGHVATNLMEISSYSSQLPLKPIIRKANSSDIHGHEQNIKDAKDALKICAEAIKDLKLDMNLLSAEYTLDKAKIIFSYVADERVDFRELLKSLAARLRTRIELRQIGTRDKAKLIGGIGLCGLPLCCSTFLNEFDGISINRAKNQMLAINVPKLSGHCGKLICCLKYEDDAYTEAKKDFPNIGERLVVDNVNYKVTSLNIVSRIVKIESDGDMKFLPLDDYKKIIANQHPTEKTGKK
ncbi:MAG: regulatory iron-sulfur-containing complex subunit RicT [Erysipelotrichaceae bacterium]|nr:regulatory iron-sulfur-containing complex subunit RicT [Erysipelotrichaceae bacterium]